MRIDKLFISQSQDYSACYAAIEDILEDLHLDIVSEKKAEFEPHKQKYKPKIEAKHEFDPYTSLELSISIATGAPVPTESKNSDIIKVQIEYEGKIVTELSSHTRTRRSGYFGRLYNALYVRIFKPAAIEEYKEYAEKLIFQIMDRVREVYDLPTTFKEPKGPQSYGGA